MTSRLLDIIIGNANEHLDTILAKDTECIKIRQKMSKQFAKLNKLKLTRKQSKAVDELLTTYNEENARCCRIIYEQGFKDCISLLKEMGII